MGVSVQGLGLWLARRYPDEWRRRFGADLDDFLDARGVRTRDLAGLVAGLVDAHIQVLGWKGWWPTMNRHVARGLMLSSVAVVLLLADSASLLKASEDGAVAILEHDDLVARVGLSLVIAAAALGAAALVLGYGRLIWLAGRRLLADGDRQGFAALLAPAVVAGALFAQLLLVARYVNGPQVVMVLVLAVSGILGVTVSLWCLGLALRRAEVVAVPVRAARPAAVALASCAVLGLVGEMLWASRVATIPSWSHLAGVVSMPMPLTVLAVAVCGLAAALLAFLSRREVALSAKT